MISPEKGGVRPPPSRGRNHFGDFRGVIGRRVEGEKFMHKLMARVAWFFLCGYFNGAHHPPPINEERFARRYTRS